MCGLVGVAGDLSQADVKAFNAMLYFDYVRGSHSTGVASINGYGKEPVTLIKAATDPLGLMAFKAYDQNVTAFKRVLMGHNRHATKGSINRPNAHPFHVGNIVGAHNGTLDYLCLKDLADGPEGETDSEQLVATIDAFDGDIARAIALASGAWALTIYNIAENELSLVRNAQRPLFYCLSESKKTLYWASESWMLNVALHRENIKHMKVMELPVDTILSWGVPKAGQIFAEKPGREKAEGKQSTNFRHGNNTPWMDWGADDNETPPTNRQRLNSPTTTVTPSAPKTAPTSGGSASSGPTTDSAKPTDTLDEGGWEAYMEGYHAGEAGAYRATNPYSPTTQRVQWEQWRDGWIAGDAAPVGAKDATKKDIVKPADNVVPFTEKGSAANKGAQTRRGPSGSYINAGKFRELTKNECGWCNNPITFDDKGFFMTHGQNTIYVCETHGCSSDKTLEQQA